MKTIQVLPNVVTFGNLASGLFSICFSMTGYPALAAYLIFGGMIFDLLDGKVARLTNTESEFGIHLDSLTDLISFGVAPMVLVNSIFFHEPLKMEWIIGLLYTGCGAFRLARYNVQRHEEEKNCFSGLPIPAAAGVLASFVLVYLTVKGIYLLLLIPMMMVVLAFLMVSTIKYPDFQKVDLKKKNFVLSFIGLVILIAISFIYPFFNLLLFFGGYALSGIFLTVTERFHSSTAS